jgi:curli biogenesis system outer membrane secretion channel CsgG
VLDQTGKEQFTEGGSGKFITQGAGDIVQSALFRTGATVLNRRDPRIMETEVKWGVANPKSIVPSNFFITGSINSLDFIPGGGIDVTIGGVGPRYREHRILIGLDLTMTETKTGRVVANIPLQKQIFANDAAFGIGRFFGDTLVVAEVGNKQREAVHFALRQMLNLATFELLTQVMHPKNYSACRSEIDQIHGAVNQSPAAVALAEYNKHQQVKGVQSVLDTKETQPSEEAEVVPLQEEPVAPSSDDVGGLGSPASTTGVNGFQSSHDDDEHKKQLMIIER